MVSDCLKYQKELKIEKVNTFYKFEERIYNFDSNLGNFMLR